MFRPTDLWAGGREAVSSGIVELDLIVARHHGLVRNLLDKTFSLRLSDVEVKTCREKRIVCYLEYLFSPVTNLR